MTKKPGSNKKKSKKSKPKAGLRNITMPAIALAKIRSTTVSMIKPDIGLKEVSCLFIVEKLK